MKIQTLIYLQNVVFRFKIHFLWLNFSLLRRTSGHWGRLQIHRPPFHVFMKFQKNSLLLLCSSAVHSMDILLSLLLFTGALPSLSSCCTVGIEDLSALCLDSTVSPSLKWLYSLADLCSPGRCIFAIYHLQFAVVSSCLDRGHFSMETDRCLLMPFRCICISTSGLLKHVCYKNAQLWVLART